MKVFIVQDDSQIFPEIVAVFANRKDAEQFVIEGRSLFIEEHEVNE